jgi:AraC-like DNA-binding protein
LRAANPGLARLRAVCDPLPFEPHDIARQLDARGHYAVVLHREFPLLIKLFHYTSHRHTPGPTWHERLELFLPLDGPARFRMGKREVALAAGDLLVVDNLQPHHVVDFPGFDTRAIVVSFMPGFVFSLGSPSHDYAFLLPFYSKHEPAVMRAEAEVASRAHDVLARLVECYCVQRDRPYYQAGCKAFLLELLFHLAQHFRPAEVLQGEFVRQQERSARLKPVFDHLSEHFAEKLTVGAAAKLVHMSRPQFMKRFKKVAGMTFVTYVHHVRLSHAVPLLKETDRTVADIANHVGFTDQSYFDRRFKAAFGVSPKEFRARATASERA